MKRSEMIEILENMSFDYYAWHSVSPEEVLDVLEKAGMLPPSKTIMIPCNNRDVLEGIHLAKSAHSWDDEDEVRGSKAT